MIGHVGTSLSNTEIELDLLSEFFELAKHIEEGNLTVPKKPHKEILAELCEALDRLPRAYDVAAGSPELKGRGSATGYEDYTRLLKKAVEKLSLDGKPYVIDNAVRETEMCTWCHEEFTGGCVTIVNPALQENQNIPYVAVHVMKEHQFTSFGDSEPKEEIDLELLRRLVYNESPRSNS